VSERIDEEPEDSSLRNNDQEPAEVEHKDEYQVQLDVNRSFINFPFGELV
jgi:hypothetical protein